jgi:hypothetical protein
MIAPIRFRSKARDGRRWCAKASAIKKSLYDFNKRF